MEEHYKSINKALDWFTFRKDRMTVFRDCIYALAMMISTRTDAYKREERLAELEEINQQYGGEFKTPFEEVIRQVVAMLKKLPDNMGDHLGRVYMALIPKSKQKQTAQVFTPYHLAGMMAEMTFEKATKELKTKPFISVNDPCVGAGCFMIATCDYFAKKKLNYLTQLQIVCNDLDLLCVHMTYVQLSFIGASAVVEHKNTLSMEKWDEFRTLGYLLMHTVNHYENEGEK
jgi:hypothetical protein